MRLPRGSSLASMAGSTWWASASSAAIAICRRRPIGSISRSVGPQPWKRYRIETDPAQQPPRRSVVVPVLTTFSLRPSTLNKNLFSSVGAVGPILVTIAIACAAVFLILEVAALITGTVLTRTITRSIGDLYSATLHVAQGDFTHRVQVRTRDQLGALGESFNNMTDSIASLIDEQRKRQRLEHEIAIASEVQQQLFPKALPELPGLGLAAICRPARVVSGDYYDFVRLGPDKRRHCGGRYQREGNFCGAADGQPASRAAQPGHP